MSPRDDIARLTPELRRYARALALPELEDRTEAADHLVQEAIVRALRLDWSDREASLRVWLFATINHLNRARRRSRSAQAQGGEGAGTVARSVASIAPRGPGVIQALDRLGCEEREALLLVALEGLTYAEACETLNIPRPTLIARLVRARKTLAESMDSIPTPEHRGRRPQTPHLRLVK